METHALAVIMPALNEEANIASAMRAVLAALQAFGIDGELVVVDDGSTDRTGQIVKEALAGDGRIRLVRHETPHGIGGAFWDGVAAAASRFVTLMPGDGENNPAETLRYFGLMEHVDFVVPFVFNKGVRPWSRRVLSACYTLIINSTFGVHFHYTNGCSIFHKAMLDAMPCHETGFFFQTDILVRAARQGYLFAEVPCQLQVRRGGRSKAVSLKSLWRVIRGYCSLLWAVYFSPQRPRRGGYVPGTRTADRHTPPEAC